MTDLDISKPDERLRRYPAAADLYIEGKYVVNSMVFHPLFEDDVYPRPARSEYVNLLKGWDPSEDEAEEDIGEYTFFELIDGSLYGRTWTERDNLDEHADHEFIEEIYEDCEGLTVPEEDEVESSHGIVERLRNL